MNLPNKKIKDIAGFDVGRHKSVLQSWFLHYLRKNVPASPRRDLRTPCPGHETQGLEAEMKIVNFEINCSRSG